MILIPFRASHLQELKQFDGQEWTRNYLRPEYAEGLQNQHAFSMTKDGEVIACGGLQPLYVHRAVAWVLLSAQKVDMLGCVRAMSKVIDGGPFQRVEAYVDAAFPQGKRLAELLGFQLETPEPMPFYLEDGRSAYHYAKIKDQ